MSISFKKISYMDLIFLFSLHNSLKFIYIHKMNGIVLNLILDYYKIK